MKFFKSIVLIILFCLSSLLMGSESVGQDALQFHTWNIGKHSFEAKLLGFSRGEEPSQTHSHLKNISKAKVVLETKKGKKLKIPIARFSPKSLRLVRKINAFRGGLRSKNSNEAKPTSQLPKVAPLIRVQELAAIDRKEKEALAGIDLEEEKEKTAGLEKDLAKRKGKSSGLSSSPKILQKAEQKLEDQKAIQQFRISMLHRVTEDSEQARRRVKVKYPVLGDVRYTEHKGKYLNDKELAVVKKAEKWKEERLAALKEEGRTAKTAADAYIRSLQETGIIRLDVCTPIGQTRTDPPHEAGDNDVKDWTNVWYEVEYVSNAGIKMQKKVYVSVIQSRDKGEPTEGLWSVSPRERALEIMGNWLPPVNRIR